MLIFQNPLYFQPALTLVSNSPSLSALLKMMLKTNILIQSNKKVSHLNALY